MGEKLKDRVFKTRSQKFGGHWDVTVFSADGPNYTFANIGTLRMNESDFVSFQLLFKADHFIISEVLSP